MLKKTMLPAAAVVSAWVAVAATGAALLQLLRKRPATRAALKRVKIFFMYGTINNLDTRIQR